MYHRLKTLASLSLAAILCTAVFAPGVVHGQTNITATVNVTRPAPSCAVSGTNDLDFGGYEIETGTAGGATITSTATTATRFSSSGAGTWSGSPSWGTFAVKVNNTSTATTIAVSYPTNLETGSSCSTASCRVPFATGNVAYGSTATQGIFAAGGLSIPASGVGTTTDRFYRLGGTISGIDLTKATGVYEAEITVTVTCGS